MLTIGWFSTGRDEAARQLLQVTNKCIQSGQIEGNIIFVFCNREPKESEESDQFIELVQSYNIPLVCFSPKIFQGITYTQTAEKNKTYLSSALNMIDRL